MRFLTFLVLGAAVAACQPIPTVVAPGDDAPVVEVSGVSAQFIPSGVRITNNSSTEIRFVASNPNWLGLLASCAGTSTGCQRLLPGDVATVEKAAIHGYEDAADVLVRFWAGQATSAGEEILLRRANSR